jgi:elongation factor G
MSHTTEQVRNLALTGHSGAGKTALAEALIFNTGQLSRLGRIEDGTTVSDFDTEEVERKMSVKMSLLTGEWNDFHYDIMDTPGYADFIPETLSALRVADGSVVVIDAAAGIDVGTERVWRYAGDYRLPRIVFVNKMDRPDIDLPALLAQIEDRFGRGTVAVQYPVDPGEGFSQVVDLLDMKLIRYADGKASIEELPAELLDDMSTRHEHLVEAIAETDEELMETYFNDGGLETAALKEGLRKAVLSGEVAPVIFGDAYNNVAADRLLQLVADVFPSPAQSPGLRFIDGDGNEHTLAADAGAPLSGLVFKTVAEQHVGELSFVRLYAGTLNHGDEVTNISRHKSERVGQIFELNGHERHEVDHATAGDIVALVKLKDTHTGNTLAAKGHEVPLPAVDFPEPLIRVAVTPAEKGGDERMVSGLQQLHEEDPSFQFRFDGEIRQSVLAAQGDLHLETILKRLKDRFSVDVATASPRIPYRETIRSKAEGHYRHKKQSGGRGQFGEVALRVEPLPRGSGFEFRNEVVGGSIPTNFIPAVEKGLQEALVEGPISASQVVDLAVIVHDGKHHPVDSDEVSFKLAAAHAFREAFLAAKPALLEPIYHVTITVPEEFLGDVMGDLTSRRGRISGTSADGHFQVIEADVPLSEMDRYATRLRSMSQGKGLHTQELVRYEEVPGDVQAKIAEEAASARAQAA